MNAWIRIMKHRHTAYLGLALFLVGFGLICPAVFAQDGGDKDTEEKITFKVTGDVYYGDKNRFSNPCVMDREKVFEKIPAYQTIKQEGLDKTSARYFFLLEEANKVFRDKVKAVTKKLEYDLTVEKGEIKASKKGYKFKDITKDVIKAIQD